MLLDGNWMNQREVRLGFFCKKKEFFFFIYINRVTSCFQILVNGLCSITIII